MAFRKPCVPLCGESGPDEGGAAGCVDRIGARYAVKRDIPMTGMNSQTGPGNPRPDFFIRNDRRCAQGQHFLLPIPAVKTQFRRICNAAYDKASFFPSDLAGHMACGHLGIEDFGLRPFTSFPLIPALHASGNVHAVFTENRFCLNLFRYPKACNHGENTVGPPLHQRPMGKIWRRQRIRRFFPALMTRRTGAGHECHAVNASKTVHFPLKAVKAGIGCCLKGFCVDNASIIGRHL
nr:DUF6783 domain-containing protein [Lachnoclostridium pacaense]